MPRYDLSLVVRKLENCLVNLSHVWRNSLHAAIRESKFVSDNYNTELLWELFIHNSHLRSSYSKPEEDYQQAKATTIPQLEALSATGCKRERWSGACRRSPLQIKHNSRAESALPCAMPCAALQKAFFCYAARRVHRSAIGEQPYARWQVWLKTDRCRQV